MPILSPLADVALLGVGNGTVRLTATTLPFATQVVTSGAGGWSWVAPDEVAGPGGYAEMDSWTAIWQLARVHGTTTARTLAAYMAEVAPDTPVPPYLQAFNLPAGPVRIVQSLFAATSFYGNGVSAWLAYLADGRTGSWDSYGFHWPSRVALGYSYEGDQIFTDATGQPIILRWFESWGDETWHEQTIAAPDPWVALPSGGYFSREFRGAYAPNGGWYACGYLAEYGGLCVWHVGFPVDPVWRLSTDGRDFNPDCRTRVSDKMFVVATAIDQGESAARIYELDFTTGQWRVNGGAWQPLVPATTTPPSTPLPVFVAPLPHHLHCGSFFKTSNRDGIPDNPSCPGNCEVAIPDDSGYERATLPLRRESVWPDVHGDFVYYDAPKWPDPLPALPPGKEYGQQLYCDPAESLDAFWVRCCEACDRFAGKPLAIVAQAYDRNGREQDLVKLKNMQSFWPELARKYADRVTAIYYFSDGRPGGTRDHEDIREWHHATLAAIPAAPVDPEQPPIDPPVDPEPGPEPEPEPQPPEPEEPPMPSPAPGRFFIYPQPGSLSGSFEVQEIPHQDANLFPGLPIVGLEIVSGPHAGQIMQGSGGSLTFRSPGPGIPGGGERFVNSGNVYAAISGDANASQHWEYLKSGGHGASK